MRQRLAAQLRTEGRRDRVGVRWLAAAGAVIGGGSDGDSAQRRLSDGRAMIDEDDVTARDADAIATVARRRRQVRREAQRERQRIFRAPCDLDQRLSEARAVGVIQRIRRSRHLGQAHRLPVRRIGIGGIAGRRSDHLFEDQHVIHGELQRPTRPGRAIPGVIRRHGRDCRSYWGRCCGGSGGGRATAYDRTGTHASTSVAVVAPFARQHAQSPQV